MTDLVERTLRRHADDAAPHLSAATPEAVARRAEALRRRQRAVATAVVAGTAVVATAVTIGVGVGVAGGGATRPVEPAGPTSSSTPRAVTTTVSSVTTVPRGPRPDIAYGVGGRLHLPDGRVVDPPEGSGSTWFRDEYLVRDDLRRPAMRTTLTRLSRRIASAVVSTDPAWAAWTDRDGVVDVVHLNGKTDPTAVPRAVPGVTSLAGLLSGHRPVANTDDGVVVVGPSGNRRLPGLRAATASTERGGLVGGELTGGGSGVVDAASGRVLWRTSMRLLRFSPDGEHVIGEPAGALRSDRVSLLDARTGRVQATVRFAAGSHVDAQATAWDDDSHALVLAVDRAGRRQTLLRLSAGGRVDRAIDVLNTSGTIVFQRTP